MHNAKIYGTFIAIFYQTNKIMTKKKLDYLLQIAGLSSALCLVQKSQGEDFRAKKNRTRAESCCFIFHCPRKSLAVVAGPRVHHSFLKALSSPQSVPLNRLLIRVWSLHPQGQSVAIH